MLWGKRCITIIFVFILIGTLFPIFNFPESKGDLSNPSVLTNHSTIYINGNSNFISSNGVVSGNGLKNNPYIIENWYINASSNNGIEIRNTDAYFIIRNCHIYNGSSMVKGIYLIYSNNGVIENNRITNIYYGINLRNSNYNIIKNNSCVSNRDAIYIQSNSFNNSLLNNICNNNSGRGIVIDEADNIIILNNTCNSNKYHGILLAHSNSHIVDNNTCSFNGYYGIPLTNSDYNIISNNTCNFNVDYGIRPAHSSNYNTIINNTCNSNKDIGIALGESDSNFVFNNICINNSCGISLSNNKDNIIYNNYFNNTINYIVWSGSGNTWNISKTIGKNIVNGPFLGGNYWSNYTGTDNDGDGLGDTELPYGPGDNLPLTKLVDLAPPTIMDNTTKIPTTGDEFIINATVFDTGKVEDVYVKYWFDNDKSSNDTMNRTHGNIICGDYSKNITVPSYAFKLYYILSANDMVGYWNCTATKILDVIDNDAPSILDYTKSIPSTGKIFSFNFSAIDNIEVSNAYLEFWFDNGSHQNLTLIPKGIFYNKKVLVPSNALILNYKLSAIDTSNNLALPVIRILDVIDNDKPVINDLSDIPSTGDEYIFSFEIIDNIEVSVAYLEYWVDNGRHYNITLPKERKHQIIVPHNAYVIYAIITALDISNNQEQIEIKKSVIDNDSPIIDDLSTSNPETGRTFLIKWTVFENRILNAVSLEYWFDDSEHILKNLDLNFDNGSYELPVEVPINAKTFDYIITAGDASNNIAQDNNSLPVIDIIPPTITDLTEGIPTTGEEFLIKGFAEDNIGIESLYLEYWFDLNDHLNISFNENHLVNVPSNAKELHYVFYVMDINKNSAILMKKLNVIDNDKPMITDYSSKYQEGYKFSVKVEDNINVDEVSINYWHENGNNKTILAQLKNGLYEYMISIPNGTEKLYYIILAVDTSKNLESTDKKTVEFEILMPEPEQSEPELEPSPQSKKSTRNVYWVIYLIVILIIIIIVAVVVYSYNKKKQGSKLESPTPEAVTIKPTPSPTLKNTQEKISVIPAVQQLSRIKTVGSDIKSTTSTSIAQKLPGTIPTTPGVIPQQIPQVEQRLQLPPVQSQENKQKSNGIN